MEFKLDGTVHYIAKQEHSEYTHSVTLTIVEINAWNLDGTPDLETAEEVAIFYVKWDGCSHVGFRSPDMNKEWVHVCGAASFKRTMLMMQWAWGLAVNLLKVKGFNPENPY